MQMMQSSQQSTMQYLIASRKGQLDKMFEEDKDDDADSRRGSFNEFYRFQKVMPNLDDEHDLNFLGNDGYVTGYNRWNDEQDNMTYESSRLFMD